METPHLEHKENLTPTKKMGDQEHYVPALDLADILRRKTHVRSTLESGHQSAKWECPLRANSGHSGKRHCPRHVSKGSLTSVVGV